MPDLPEYLALYLKYPAVEYLWKMKLGRWLVERQEGKGHLFRKLVNLRRNGCFHTSARQTDACWHGNGQA